MNTVVTQKLGIRHPIIQGPFGGGLSTVELAATVSNAGGMGSYGAHLLTPGEIEDVTAGIRARTAGPFAMNLWVDSLDARARDAKPEDFERAAADSLHGTLALVRQVVTAVKIPVIAAGGIADAAGVAAALKLGAGAVQVGTAFLACEESGAPPLHREFLFSPSARRTRLSNRVSGRLARFGVTPALEELEQLSRTHLGYPLQGALTRPLKLSNTGDDKVRDGLFYAGQGAPLLRHRKATELIAELLKEIV
jgi:NAD(P)H-dependent flavin oxidoreductase YrpB (nitropropane dioxygenase family)